MYCDNGSVAFFLLHAMQNSENQDEFLITVGNWIENTFKANGMDRLTVVSEIKRYLDYVEKNK